MVHPQFKKFVRSHPSLLSSARILLAVYRAISGVVIYIGIVGMVIKKKILCRLDKKSDEQKLMINVGGGYFFRRHWKVLDYRSQWYGYVGDAIDYDFDLTSGAPLPFESNSVSFFYSSHVLEHIPEEFCQQIFNEMFRCLRHGGAVRLTMPDFDLACMAFSNGDTNFFVNNPGNYIEDQFLDFFATYWKGRISPQEIRKNFMSMKKHEFADYYTEKIPRDSQKKMVGNHINWWNYEKISKMLTGAGFRKVYRSTPGGSHFTEMKAGGKNGFDYTRPEISLFVEAVRE